MAVRYVDRETVDLKFEQLTKYYCPHSGFKLDPTTVRIKEIGLKTVTYDLGCIAYRKRKSKTITKDGKHSVANVVIAPSSLCKKRVDALDYLLESMYVHYSTGAMADSSLCLHIYNLLRFGRWCDDNSFYNYMLSIDEAKDALQAFNENSVDCPIREKITDNSVRSISNSIVYVYSLLFDISKREIRSNIAFVSSVERESTQSPSIRRASSVLALYNCLFEGLADFVLNGKPYPYHLKLPHENIWIFPTQRWFVTKNKLAVLSDVSKLNGTCKNIAIDYAAGRYRTYENVRKIYPGYGGDRYSINKTVAKYETENLEITGHYRKKMAYTACKSFLMMFIANTGINLSQVADLEWSDSFDVDKSRHGFKTIKKRAGGKEVEFLITAGFYKYFRKYLDLRKYLLGDENNRMLFFHCGHSGLVKKIDSHTVKTIKETMENLTDDNFPHVTAREWRAYRSNYLHKNHDIATIAMLMQNDIDTVLDNYSEGNQSESAIEMTDYFEEFAIKVEPKGKTLAVIPSGKCNEFGSPSEMMGDVIVKPDCITPEGCLFCDNYAVQEDEVSVRKLLSMEYVILETKDIADSPEEFNAVHGKNLMRINQILSALESRSKKMKETIKTIRQEVDGEMLDPYWDAQLTKLFRMGLIF